MTVYNTSQDYMQSINTFSCVHGKLCGKARFQNWERKAEHKENDTCNFTPTTFLKAK